MLAWTPLAKWLLYDHRGKQGTFRAASSCESARTRQTPLDGFGAGRITLLILHPLLAQKSCERKSGNGKFWGSERFISSVGGIRKGGLARSGGTKLESLELIGGNSRTPLTLDNMDHKISYKENIARLFRQRAQIRKWCRLTNLSNSIILKSGQ